MVLPADGVVGCYAFALPFGAVYALILPSVSRILRFS